MDVVKKVAISILEKELIANGLTMTYGTAKLEGADDGGKVRLLGDVLGGPRKPIRSTWGSP